MELYRGYVPINDDKSPKVKFSEDRNLLALDDVCGMRGYGGVLNERTVLIDVDNTRDALKVLTLITDNEINCRVTKTTRGMHFVFVQNQTRRIEQCYTGVTLACGIKADIKVGLKRSYQVLKLAGTPREVVREIEGDEPDGVPLYLLPIKHGVDFSNMTEGQRNTKLYSYILKLKSHGFTDAEIKETERIVNQYVLDEPIGDDELETILRDASFQKPSFFINKQFRHDKLAAWLINTHHIKLIDGHLYMYNGTHYNSDKAAIDRAMIDQVETLKYAQRLEVWRYMQIKAPVANLAPARYISFANGIYDIETDTLTEHSPNIVITNHIEHNYQNTPCDIVDSTLDKISCNQTDVRCVLEECVGQALYRANTHAGAVFLIGSGANGKSTFLKALYAILGDKNTASLDLRMLADRFNTAELKDKLANIGDDISSEYLTGNTMALFKKVVTGESLPAENKGKDPFKFTPYCKLFFSVNEMPQMHDRSHGLSRRLVPIPFMAKFTRADADYNPNITAEFTSKQALERLIFLGIEGLKRVLANKGYTQTKYQDELLHEIEEANNPLIEFIREKGREEFVDAEISMLYHHYRVWCEDSGVKPLTRRQFTFAVCSTLDLGSKQAKIMGRKTRKFYDKKLAQ